MTRSAPPVLVWCASLMIMSGTMTVGTLVAFNALVAFLYLPLERFAVLTLTVLILLGGLFPQSGVASRHRAAVGLLSTRENRARADVDVEFDLLPDARSSLAAPHR